MLRIVQVLLLLVGCSALGCDASTGPFICSQTGCDSGLEIEFVGDLPETFEIVLVVPEFHPITIQCSASSPCGNKTFVPDFTPGRLFVEVQGESLDFREEFMPRYERIRPNGPDCPPECQRGTITVDTR